MTATGRFDESGTTKSGLKITGVGSGVGVDSGVAVGVGVSAAVGSS